MSAIRGAHALVTGGSSGIGLATAKLLARHGASVSVVARTEDRLARAVEQVRGSAPEASVVAGCADVTRPSELADAFAGCCSQQGPCDILVTAAGSAHPGYFTALDDAVFRSQMETDYFGTLHAIRLAVPGMVDRRRGHVVAIASTAALVGVFGYSAYAPAKYAVRGLVETLRPELTPHGVVVSCAYPPDTRTPGFERENELKPPESARVSAAITPRDPDDVARAIVKGIARDRLVITADPQTAALARVGSVLAPVVRRVMDRQVRRARNT